MLLGLVLTVGASAAADESAYVERHAIYEEQPAAALAPPALPAGEWLPACSPRIVIAAIFRQGNNVRVVGYVKRSMIGRNLRLHSWLASGKTVLKFKTKRNGYFNVKVPRPRHKAARSAAWRVTSGKSRTPWVKFLRPLVLNNVHQRKGLLMVNGQLNVAARDDSVVDVQRLDNCRTATRLGRLGLRMDGTGLLDGPVQLRDLLKPVATFVRLRVRVRVREPGTGAWGKSFWSLSLPVVLRP